MARLIDADELLRRIPSEEWVAKWVISEAPTITPDMAQILAYECGKSNAQSQGEWIPVSERLPEEANKSYLVTVKYGDDIICSCQRFFFGEGIGWNDDCVVAWQPLPKPYEEADNDERRGY